jgi:hypothetical protein
VDLAGIVGANFAVRDLTPLKAAVLDAIAAQLPLEDRNTLTQQIAALSVSRCENTGAGFFTYFSRNARSAKKVHSDTKAAFVTAKIGNLENALGFILWMKDGQINFLEGYTMALDSTVGMDFRAISFELAVVPPNSN